MKTEKSGTEPSERLFVGDMSVRYNSQIIFDLFSQFGTVVDVDINQGGPHDFRPFTGFGFVSFTTKESATMAKQALNGYLNYGRRMRIGWASRSVNVVEREPTVEVFFSFRYPKLKTMVYEQTIIDLIGEITDCEVLDVAFKTYVINTATPLCFGSGFVHFPVTPQGVAAAKLLASRLKNVTVQEILYDCKIAHSFNELLWSRPDLRVMAEVLLTEESTQADEIDLWQSSTASKSNRGGDSQQRGRSTEHDKNSNAANSTPLHVTKPMSYASFQDMRHLLPPAGPTTSKKSPRNQEQTHITSTSATAARNPPLDTSRISESETLRAGPIQIHQLSQQQQQQAAPAAVSGWQQRIQQHEISERDTGGGSFRPMTDRQDKGGVGRIDMNTDGLLNQQRQSQLSQQDQQHGVWAPRGQPLSLAQINDQQQLMRSGLQQRQQQLQQMSHSSTQVSQQHPQYQQQLRERDREQQEEWNSSYPYQQQSQQQQQAMRLATGLSPAIYRSGEQWTQPPQQQRSMPIHNMSPYQQPAPHQQSMQQNYGPGSYTLPPPVRLPVTGSQYTEQNLSQQLQQVRDPFHQLQPQHLVQHQHTYQQEQRPPSQFIPQRQQYPPPMLMHHPSHMLQLPLSPRESPSAPRNLFSNMRYNPPPRAKSPANSNSNSGGGHNSNNS